MMIAIINLYGLKNENSNRNNKDNNSVNNIKGCGMSRALRKRKAKREYKEQQLKKVKAIIDNSINTAIEISKQIANNNAVGALIISEMGRERNKSIVSSLVMKYNKYGKFPKVGGVIVGLRDVV